MSTSIADTSRTRQTLTSSDILLNLIVILLAPVFLGVTAGDVGLARRAALETINDYRAGNPADLFAVAQIVGFGLAALGSLSLSLADDLSLSMTLRLRGNAIACDRAAERNRRARAKNPIRDAVAPESVLTESVLPESVAIEDSPRPEFLANEAAASYEPEMFLSAGAEALLAAESLARLEPAPSNDSPPEPTLATVRTPAEKRHQQMWGMALSKDASDIAASLPNLAPAERDAAALRAGLLSSTAYDLITGAPPTPFKPLPS